MPAKLSRSRQRATPFCGWVVRQMRPRTHTVQNARLGKRGQRTLRRQVCAQTLPLAEPCNRRGLGAAPSPQLGPPASDAGRTVAEHRRERCEEVRRLPAARTSTRRPKFQRPECNAGEIGNVFSHGTAEMTLRSVGDRLGAFPAPCADECRKDISTRRADARGRAGRARTAGGEAGASIGGPGPSYCGRSRSAAGVKNSCSALEAQRTSAERVFRGRPIVLGRIDHHLQAITVPFCARSTDVVARRRARLAKPSQPCYNRVSGIHARQTLFFLD